MKSLSRHIIRYDAGLTNINLKEVGGKGYNLFRLHEYGFNVPPWFIVTLNTFEASLVEHSKEINRILSYTDFTNYNDLQKSSSQIAEMIVSLKIDNMIVTEINNQCSDIIGFQKNASVRSSILDEDSAENSFAGLMDSYLNVPPEKIADKIKRVWASAYSLRALVYRKKKRLPFKNISAAVIIQSMINSESSGVAFTSDPENISGSIVISAGYGLGEGIVLDSVETDTYRIDKSSNEISNEIRQKDNKIVFDALSGTKCEELSSDKKSKHVLSEKQVLELSDVLKCIEEKFGSPQDVEWAYDKDGTLFILQSRPVIFKKQIRPHRNLTVWDNSNIIESYPGITLPLTFTFIRRGYEANFRGAILSLIINKKDPEINFEIFKNMIGLINGRVYYNLLNWYRMLSYLPNFESYRESWDQMIGISNKIDFPSNKLSLLNKVICSLKLARILLFVEGNTKKFYKYFDKYFEEYRNTDFSKSELSELTSAYKRLENELLPKWYLTLYSDITSMKYYSWLKNHCTKWGLDKYSGLHNDLLCGQRDIESVKPVKAIIGLAESITANKEYAELFSGNSEDEIWRNLETNTKYEELRRDFASYLENYGDRCPEELKLEKHTYRESPKDLIRIVKSYVTSEMSIEKFGKEEEKINRKAIAFVRSTLGNPFKKLVFNFILRNARLSVRNRENMRFARSRAYGLVRRIFRRIGVIFLENHIINEADDIFYLTIDEVFGYIEGTSVSADLKKLIDLRKSEFDKYSEIELDDRIVHEGIPYLNINRIDEKDFDNATLLKGIGCSSGIARAAAQVVLNPNTTNGSRGCILVTRSTDPGWIFLMVSSKGIVTEKGSMLSHSAIMGREFGIPSIVNVKDATKIIADGAMIEMNGETGEIKCL
jgi:pyruvate,water dikinase